MALIKWKQISGNLGAYGNLTGSFNVSGSINVNGQEVGTGKLDETTFNLIQHLMIQSNYFRKFSSSLDATFATDAQLSSVSSSLAASISSFQQILMISLKTNIRSSSAQIDLSQATEQHLCRTPRMLYQLLTKSLTKYHPLMQFKLILHHL